MPEARPSDYVFLSDLHLASGFDPVKGSYSPRENFFYDQQFARFLDFLRRQAQEDGHDLHLVLLGDIFDFLRADSPSLSQHRYSLDASAATAVEKIEQIAAGHSVFFEALGCLLEAGFHVAFIAGNHDIEMTHAAIQGRVKELIKRAGQRSNEAADRITFHPWIYTVPGIFYAEHGQQQHWINCFPDLLLLVKHDIKGRIPLPVGSHFEIYLQALRKANGRPEGEYSPSLRNLILSPLRHPTILLRTAGAQVRFLGAILSAVFRSSNPLQNAKRKAVLREALPALSSQTGLSSETLSALAEMWQCFDLGKVLSKLREQVGKRRVERAEPNYLYRAAATIHELLKYKNEQVPNYIFGHTHQPAMQPLGGGTPTAIYVNGGSWNGGAEPAAGLFRYICITAQPGSGSVETRVLVWDDSVERPVLAQQNS